MLYVIKAAELISFPLLHHRLSTFFSARLPRIFSCFSGREQSRTLQIDYFEVQHNRSGLSERKKNIYTIIQSNKKFPKTGKLLNP